MYLKKKDILLRQGEHCKYAAIVIKSEFLISRILSDGVEVILGYSEGNELIADYSAFLSESESQLNIQAISDSELLLYSQNKSMPSLNITWIHKDSDEKLLNL